MSTSSSPLLSRIAAYRRRRRSSREGGKADRFAQVKGQTDESLGPEAQPFGTLAEKAGHISAPPPKLATVDSTGGSFLHDEQQQERVRQAQVCESPRPELRTRVYSPKPAAGSISTSQQFTPGMISEEDEEGEVETDYLEQGPGGARTVGFAQQSTKSVQSAEAWRGVGDANEGSHSAGSAAKSTGTTPHERIVVSRSRQVVMAWNRDVGDVEDRLAVPGSIGDLRNDKALFQKIVMLALERANGTRAQKNQVARMGFGELSNTLAKLDAVNFKVMRRRAQRAGARRGVVRSSEDGASAQSIKKAGTQHARHSRNERQNVARYSERSGKEASTKPESSPKASGRNSGKGGIWNQEEQEWLDRVFHPEERDFNKDSVIVAVRLRPLQQKMGSENNEKRAMDTDATAAAPSVIVQGNTITVLSDGATFRSEKRFTFDHCYDSSSDPNGPTYGSQEAVFSDLGIYILQNAWKGYNCSLFAYGQTGSGKSYTIMGPNGGISGFSGGEAGIMPRMCGKLFTMLEHGRAQGASGEFTDMHIEMSYLEVYNEQLSDLLAPNADGSKSKLEIHEYPQTGVIVKGLSKHAVANFEEIQDLMKDGNNFRAMASTARNATSSRSHAICTLYLSQHRSEGREMVTKFSRIHLVDLAGSENAGIHHSIRDKVKKRATLKETSSINKSLFTLSICISTLAKQKQRGKSHVPYRNSVLTMLLKDSLGGNARTVMIANISPDARDRGQTLSTLRYAGLAKKIQMHAKINEIRKEKMLSELKAEIEELRERLKEQARNEALQRELREKNAAMEDVESISMDWSRKRRNTMAMRAERGQALGLRGISNGNDAINMQQTIPHLVNLSEDPLLSESLVYFLREGPTRVGSSDAPVQQDIVLQGLGIEAEHCLLLCSEQVPGVGQAGVDDKRKHIVNLYVLQNASVLVDDDIVTSANSPKELRQGAKLMLGNSYYFRFKDPYEASAMRDMKGKGDKSDMAEMDRSMARNRMRRVSVGGLFGLKPGVRASSRALPPSPHSTSSALSEVTAGADVFNGDMPRKRRKQSRAQKSPEELEAIQAIETQVISSIRLASEAADIIDELGLKGIFAFKADISAPLTEVNTSNALSPGKGAIFDVSQLCAPQALEVMLNVLYFPTADEPVFDIDKRDNPASLAKPREIEEDSGQQSDIDQTRDDSKIGYIEGNNEHEDKNVVNKKEKEEEGGGGGQNDREIEVEGDEKDRDKEQNVSVQEQKGPEVTRSAGRQDHVRSENTKRGNADQHQEDYTMSDTVNQGGEEPSEEVVDAVPLFRIPYREFQEMMDSLRSLYERHREDAAGTGGAQADSGHVDILDEVLQCFDVHSGNGDLSVPRHSISGFVGGSDRPSSGALLAQPTPYDKDGMVDPEKNEIAKDAQLAALLQENSRLVQLLRARESKDREKEEQSKPVDYFDDLRTFATLLDADLQTIAEKYVATFDLV